MPESDQWNGDDELPVSTVGRANEAVRDVLGDMFQAPDEEVEDSKEEDKKPSAKK